MIPPSDYSISNGSGDDHVLVLLALVRVAVVDSVDDGGARRIPIDRPILPQYPRMPQ